MATTRTQPRVVERARSVRVITLCTDEGPALLNWKYGAQRLGYDVTVLGVGERWGGWPWRTRRYIEAVQALKPGTLVVLVDGNDILFVRGPSSLYRAYRSIGKSLVFGAEPTCCTGSFAMDKLNGKRQIAMSTVDSRHPENRWKFPNAGCIVGTREAVLDALERVKDETDDQAGHLARYLQDPDYLQLDWEHLIVGNVNRPGMLYCVDTKVTDDADSVEMQFWERVRVGGLVEEKVAAEEDASVYNDSVGPYLYRNRTTGGVPCILHFPGKNIRGYNLMGASVYGLAFRPLSGERVPSVGKAALLGIAEFWKQG
jgi:hypothetical protein